MSDSGIVSGSSFLSGSDASAEFGSKACFNFRFLGVSVNSDSGSDPERAHTKAIRVMTTACKKRNLLIKTQLQSSISGLVIKASR